METAVTSTKVRIDEFLSIAAHIIMHSGDVMREVLSSGSLTTQFKGDVKEPFTEADVKIQTFIISGLKHHFPALNVQGEEDVVYEGKFEVDPASFSKSSISIGLFDGKVSEEFDTADSVVWVDPIDGTKSFISGQLHHCTTLIGLAIKGQPTVGIIGHYYNLGADGKTLTYAPKCYFSHAGYNKVFVVDVDKKIGTPVPIDIPPVQEFDEVAKKLRVPRGSDTTQDRNILAVLGKKFAVEANDEAGAGHLMLEVLLNNSDVYVEPKNHSKRWDICAGDALIRSAGFYFTDFNGEKYTYPQVKVGHYNENGTVCARNKRVLELVIEALKEL